MFVLDGNRPYGVICWNGLNFSRSVNDPNSRLSRVVNYLRTHGNSRRVDILRDVFKKDIKDVGRGWNTYLFSGGVHGKFFTKSRRGNHVYWGLGENSHLVTK